MHLAHYLGLLHRSQIELAKALREVGDGHQEEPDVHHECNVMSSQCDRHAEQLQPFVDRYGEDAPDEPDRLHSDLFQGTRKIDDPHPGNALQRA